MDTKITIGSLLKTFGRKLGLKLLAGEAGLERSLNSSEINRPSLALTGFVDVFNYEPLQVLGNTENEYLRTLSRLERQSALQILYQFEMPCLVITGSARVFAEHRELANRYKIPLLRSTHDTTAFIHLFHFYLDDLFAPRLIQHATLVDVYGIGLLFTGRSGIGKSEVGLDLVERQHRLVADDTVEIARKPQGILVGKSPSMLYGMMEIRGLGILDIKRLYGIQAVRRQKRVEVVVNLADWDENKPVDRTGLEDRKRTLLGIEVPEVEVALVPGKNITVIAETLALNYLLRIDGHHSARDFNKRLIKSMQPKNAQDAQGQGGGKA